MEGRIILASSSIIALGLITVASIKEGIKYKFPSRTCKECFLYPCFRGMETFSCDMAKYGCLDYKGKYDKDRLCQTSSF